MRRFAARFASPHTTGMCTPICTSDMGVWMGGKVSTDRSSQVKRSLRVSTRLRLQVQCGEPGWSLRTFAERRLGCVRGCTGLRDGDHNFSYLRVRLEVFVGLGCL